jgi:DNA-binding NarL/FixJ family response regulator/phage shock protein PspC (stress-responsive transcriptional regulator)
LSAVRRLGIQVALPRFGRVERDRVVAGVCAGIAERLRVDATLVRLVFALLAFASGAGIAAYLGLWAILPAAGAPTPPRFRRVAGTVVLVWAAVLALRGLGLADSLLWPLALFGAGMVIAGGAHTFGLGERRAQLAALLLIVAGVVVFVQRNHGGSSSVLLAPGAVAVALLLVVGPWSWRLTRERDAEHAERVRTEERAELAARVHDSVLQTLTLIQKNPDDARKLARRQERELRAWLYPDRAPAAGGTLAGALESAAAEIEELTGVGGGRDRGAARRPRRDRAHGRRAARRQDRRARARGARGDGERSAARGRGRDLGLRRRRRRGRVPLRPGPRRRLRPGRGRRRPARPRRVDSRQDGARARHGDRRLGARRGHRGGAEARMSMPLRRVVLVDDHDLFRAGVRAGLATTVEVVGEAGTVADAVPLIKELDPDVVLLDVHLPDGGGQAVIAQVAPERPGVKFLALSVSDAAEDVIGVIRAGARGYVTKAISGDELTDAVHRTADGDAVFSPRLAGFVLDAFRSGDAVADPELDQLTAREREVLQLIARGYRYKEIAARLHLSARTVESHVSAVLRKLQLSSRHELTRWAAERRLI